MNMIIWASIPMAQDLPKGGAAKDGGSLADQVAKKVGSAR